MGDSPKTLADVKTLLKEAVQLVDQLEAATTDPKSTDAPNEDSEDSEAANVPQQVTPPTV